MPNESVSSIEKKILKNYFQNQERDGKKLRSALGGAHDKKVIHIPARAGSTRVKNKNIIDICGHPLLAYTIMVAKALPVDRVIVNTDSEAIAEVAKTYGAEVPFLRPKELAGDTISPYYSSFYAKRWFVDQGYPVDMFIDMYPTNLFRNVARIKTYIEKTQNCGLLYTRARVRFNPKKFYMDKEQLHKTIPQEIAASFSFFKILNSFVAVKTDYTDIKWHEYVTVTNPIELIDIDSPADIKLAKHIIQNKIYDFGTSI